MDIKQVLELLIGNDFWGVDKLKPCNLDLYHKFTTAHHLPKDYKQLLSVTDGFVLFHAGDFIIYDMDWIFKCEKKTKYSNDYIKPILNIGYFMERNLVIDQRKANTKNYLFAGNCHSTDEFVCLGTITDFFNGFIQNKGEVPFWDENAPYQDFGVK